MVEMLLRYGQGCLNELEVKQYKVVLSELI